ncbi:glycosyltransferase family 64 protein [Rhodotorula graminis WP1]|uniref:Glycosyltransferase family 64 protein n=1 Tax=Rhodotorula graminis (strain WP1) TaxID=578459 RepID=A0A194S407_RHOGW|nr:glycosyltransferase family 64 protein [Rhodotorula graminis WP1]KPV75327.1 glycosyltransferase family 64 protein [Rhodotorula graminis WP1]
MRVHLPRAPLLALLVGVISTLLAGASRVKVQSGEVDREGRPTVELSIDPAEGFTMMIATYKRDANLSPLIKHLTTQPPPSLRHIVIVWQNVGVDLPDFLNATSLEQYSTSGVVVSVRKSERNSMNERFRPLVDWDTEVYTDAVMILDDDVVLQRNAIEWGYQQFLEVNGAPDAPGRLVGFSARDYDKVDGEVKYVVRPRKTYSMVLSNAAWLRKEWLHKYWEDSVEMRGLRDYVDQVFNCDDLLINYLVSNLTGQPPLLLQPKTPLRTIGGDGLFNRGSVAVDADGNDIVPPPSTSSPSSTDGDTDLPAPDAAIDAAAGLPAAGHFDQRRQCLSHYFAHFSAFAPAAAAAEPSPSPFYPLVRTSTSASQDVEDHSRWLLRGEAWETPEAAAYVPAPAQDAVDEGDEGEQERERERGEGAGDDWAPLSAEDLAEHEEFGMMLDDMSEDEIDELMAELNEALAEAGLEGIDDSPAAAAEEDDEGEFLGEVVEEPTLFEDDDDDEQEHASRRAGGHDEL